MDGPVALRFRLFPVASGGAQCFEETQTVQVVTEAFSVFLGDGTVGGIPPSPCFTTNTSLWIAFALDGSPDVEIGGRAGITSSGYAHFAQTVQQGPGSGLDADTLQGLGPTAFAAASHTHDASQITSGTLALARIPQGPGSGLDADLLDGLDSTAFAPASGSPNYAPASGSPNYVAKAGDTMTGPLTLSGDPTAALDAASKQYVDSANAVQDTAIASRVRKAGDTMTGPLGIAPNSTSLALRIDQGINGDGILAYVNTTSGTRTVLAANSNVVGLNVQGNGNVGIGTTSPGAKLAVHVDSGIGVLGRSTNGTGVSGVTDSFFFPGVQATSYLGSTANLGLRVDGRALITGHLGVFVENPSNAITLPPFANNDGRGLANRWDTYSSRRWKTNVQTIQGALEKVERLRGVSFDWKENGGHDIGLIAEEVGEVVPEIVGYEENGKDARSLDYARLTALLIEAVKGQQSQIRELKAEVEGLKAKLSGGQLVSISERNDQ